jgi:hypothetical protein
MCRSNSRGSTPPTVVYVVFAGIACVKVRVRPRGCNHNPRLRDPRPRPPAVLVPPTARRLRDRPARAIRPLIPRRDQHPLHNVGPHQCTGAIDQLIDLDGEPSTSGR